MNNRWLLVLFVFLFCQPRLVQGQVPETAGMNVLLIDIEDCRADVWGCYGNAICQTPNINRLASTGVVFDRAYCQFVCCNPSRSSFLTGLRPQTTRVLTNYQASREKLPPGTVSLPQALKRHGLYTANIGKLFHSTKYSSPNGRINRNAEDMVTFDRLEFHDAPPGWSGPPSILGADRNPAGPDSPFPYAQDDSRYARWKEAYDHGYGIADQPEENLPDTLYSRAAVALLEEFARTGQKRFFLSLGSSRPHTPLYSPEKYVDMYDPAKIPAPPAPPEKDQGVPGLAVKFGKPSDIWNKGIAPTPEQVRETIAAYYACVTYLDAQLGQVLDALDRSGLADNTIVIFLSDHGFHLGEHGMWSKYTLFEQSTRVPLIVRIPGNPANGSRCDGLVELVDLMPTLGELLQMPVPSNLEGTSFAPLLAQPSRPWKPAVFSTFGNEGEYNSVRTQRYRYTEWNYKGEVLKELYDLQADPWETRNLADRPEMASQQSEMASRLQAGWRGALPK